MKLKSAIKYIATPAQLVMVSITMMAVVLILGLIVFALIVEYARPIQPPPTTQDKKQDRVDYARFPKKFLPDGTVHLVNEKDKEVFQIYDEDEQFLWAGKRADVPYDYLEFSHRVEPGAITTRSMKERYAVSLEFSRPLVVPVVSGERRIIERWRSDYDGRFFVGYDSAGRKIGYFGAQELAPTEKDVQPFGEFRMMFVWSPKDSYSPMLLWQTAKAIYQIDFSERHVRLLFESKDSPIKAVITHSWRQIHDWEAKYRPTILAITEADSYFLLFGDSEEVLEIEIPETFAFSVVATKSDIFVQRSETVGRPSTTNRAILLEWWTKNRHKPIKHAIELYRLGGNGSLDFIWRYEYTTEPVLQSEPSRRFEALNEKTQQYLTTASPTVFYPIWRWYSKVLNPSSLGRFHDALQAIIWTFKPVNMTYNLALGFLLAAAALWHGWARRTTWGKLIFWLIFVVAFNLAGLLTYLALNHTPLIRCDACGKKRGLDRPHCPACRAQLPIPRQRDIDLIQV